MLRSDRLAQKLTIGIPALLLAGAYIGELAFGLYPCEMCWWQRWPHFAALALGLISGVVAFPRLVIGLAALSILVSGLIGGFHAGVEYGWWEGITGCATAIAEGESALNAILNAPLVRCDQAPWSLLGVSLAGWNFLVSCGSAIAIVALLGKGRKVGIE
ncbi:MAG: disulfide bond formation protein B [Pontixanthobacter sp.]